LGYKDAHSTEMNPKTTYPVIDIMASQKKITSKGGTMRLGVYPCTLREGTKVYDAYNKIDIKERHRHRYEFNNKYLEAYENAGMLAVGINPKDNLVEVVELTGHPWFVGVQFHPEYKSTVANPHPLFEGLVKAAIDYKQKAI
jgi:CTP synthase